MATYFGPNRVQEISVTLKIKLANGQGEQVREILFTDSANGRETVAQLADLFLSACDLATAIVTPNVELRGRAL
jgi:hypothetical protein